MAATITVVAGTNTKVFNITTANQQRIITAIDRSGFPRDPDGSTFEVDENGEPVLDENEEPIPIPAQGDFSFFTTWLKNQYIELVARTESYAAQQGVVADDGLMT